MGHRRYKLVFIFSLWLIFSDMSLMVSVRAPISSSAFLNLYAVEPAAMRWRFRDARHRVYDGADEVEVGEVHHAQDTQTDAQGDGHDDDNLLVHLIQGR